MTGPNAWFAMSESEDYRFDSWMSAVDKAVKRQIQFGYSDLADYPFRDAFNDGLSPDEVASDLLSREGFQ